MVAGVPPSPPKQSTPLLQSQSNTNMGKPPAYQPVPNPPGADTSSNSNVNYGPTPIFVQHRVPGMQGEASRRACKRFTEAFIVAVLIWMLMSALVGSIADTAINGYTWRETPEWSGHYNWRVEECEESWQKVKSAESFSLVPPFPDIPDVDIDAPRPPWDTSPPYASKTSFDLSASAPSLLLVSKNTFGNVEFIADGKKDVVSVTVYARYYRKEALDRISVCKISTEDGGEGVGLYAPPNRGPWWWRSGRQDQVSFSLVVHLPPGTSSPQIINSLETDLSIFSHYLHNLQDKVYFRHLHLRSANSRIVAADEKGVFAVSGDNLNIHTSNGAITGSFSSNDTLIIRTSNGMIDVTTNLGYSNKTTHGMPYLELKTSNARITARMNLSNPGSPKGGAFEVSTQTSNAALLLSFPSTPHTSYLKFGAKTSNARADISLNPAYEGTFNLGTSAHAGQPNVQVSARSKDPSGAGRERRTWTRSIGKGHANGRIYWGDWKDGEKNGTYGEVDVKTSNAGIWLTA